MKSIKFLREVLARRAAVTGAVAAVLSLCVNQGWFGADLSARVNGWVTTLFLIGGIVSTVLVVRPKVTPVDDPHGPNGEHLVPEPAPEDVVAVHDTNGTDAIEDTSEGVGDHESIEWPEGTPSEEIASEKSFQAPTTEA